MTLSGSPAVSRCENPPLNYNWGQGAPTAGVPADHFSARWEGQFSFAAGAATFTATADDGIRLYVDGTLVINAWVDQGATTYTGTRTLTAGTHQVRVEYYDNEVDAVAQVSWTGGGADTTAPTITARTPAPGATGIAVSVSPTATFSEPMNPATLTTSTFTLVKQGTSTPVAASVSYAGQVATLDPTANLEAAATYTATVKGGAAGAKDVAGNALAADSTWTFTTAAGANQPPVPVIDSPLASLTWKVGDTVNFTGHASDPEQGTLPASALTWTLLIQHCPSNCHSHTIQTWDGVASGSFPAPDHEYPSHLELRLRRPTPAGERLDVRAAAAADRRPHLRLLADRARLVVNGVVRHCALHEYRHRRLGELDQRHHAADPERNDVRVLELVGRRAPRRTASSHPRRRRRTPRPTRARLPPAQSASLRRSTTRARPLPGVRWSAAARRRSTTHGPTAAAPVLLCPKTTSRCAGLGSSTSRPGRPRSP